MAEAAGPSGGSAGASTPASTTPTTPTPATSGTGVGADPGTKSTLGAPESAPRTTVRPIPPPRRFVIPGVVAESESEDADSDEVSDAPYRLRAPDEPDEAPERPPEPPKKIKVAGHEYDSPEAAHAALEKGLQRQQVLEGKFKAWDQGFKQAQETVTKANEVTRQWQTFSKGLQQRIAELEQTSLGQQTGVSKGSNAPNAAQPAPDADDPLSGVDLAEYRRLADEQGPEMATMWLVKQAQTAERARYQRMLDESQAPMNQLFAARAQIQKGQEIFDALRSQRAPDGVPLYPYLQNDDDSYGVGQFWVKFFTGEGISQERSYTPESVHAAHALYKDAREYAEKYLRREATDPEIQAVGAQMAQGVQTPVVRPEASLPPTPETTDGTSTQQVSRASKRQLSKQARELQSYGFEVGT